MSALDRVTNGSRNERLEESWVGVSSQPSSSSLSSAATDEIVTTGLRVQYDTSNRRRRRFRPSARAHLDLSLRPSSAGSSQEEYEESGSESDRIMTSSNEGILQHPQPSNPRLSAPQQYSSASEAASDDDDEYENSTTIGVAVEPVFTPQPNAFSHPPSSESDQPNQSAPQSYFPTPRTAGRTPSQRHSYPSQRQRQQHAPFNMISPSYQADHDAALRASLSTLLSCAAAARGLPKEAQAGSRGVPSNRIEPSTLRIVPESVVMGRTQDDDARKPRSYAKAAGHTSASSSNASLPIVSTQGKGKRKASNSKDRRSSKKTRGATIDEMVSPTLLTWVVSAGVVVLVSAIGFSAGYTIGKEIGRAEVGTIGGSEGAGCGKEGMKGGFRRLRWGSGSTSSIRA
ncbi:MAG: hypothetical protein M1835_007582 [Candelina submexicana]|nr:MAG: hypothetical protein M1835_007582 [Candelina submexicana]